MAEPFAANLDPLCECRAPLLIGVRHHSAALARAVPTILESYRPECVLVELPSDLQEWIPYLAHPDTVAPVALSASSGNGDLFFYPLADFSPELVAIRWAVANHVPVVACDLAAGHKQSLRSDTSPSLASGSDETHAEKSRSTLSELLRRTQAADTGQLWERSVETPAPFQNAEAIRRASLLFGWSVRESNQSIDSYNELREASMRSAIRKSPEKSAAVVGAFHAPALISSVVETTKLNDEQCLKEVFKKDVTVKASLVPYSFAQLDERSGYPAGIRDPQWHQSVLNASDPEALDRALSTLTIELCRELRRRGHVAGTPDATEIVRMARDLARIRGLPMPGRGELIESIQSCLVQGELFGRGREVARAAERILVGEQRGRVTSTVPRCGLAVQLEELFASLKLPGPETDGNQPREVKLDVFRNRRDRARAVLLRLLNAAQITYGKRIDSVELGGRENLVERWEVQWQHATPAMIAAASRHGVTISQVVTSMVRATTVTSEDDSIDSLPAQLIHQLQIAAECGLHQLLDDSLAGLQDAFLSTADLTQLVSAATWLQRIESGMAIGLPPESSMEFPPLVLAYQITDRAPSLESLLVTCLDRLEGLIGSDLQSDVEGLADLVHWFNGDLKSAAIDPAPVDAQTLVLEYGIERLCHWCRRTTRAGSARMRGAAMGVLGILDGRAPQNFCALTEGWFDSATDSDGRKQLRDGLAGAIQVLLPLAQSDAAWLSGLDQRLTHVADDVFLARLPSLRGGFSELTPADRKRLLEVCTHGYEERGTKLTKTRDGEDATLQLAAWRSADLAGRNAVLSLFPDIGLEHLPQANAIELASESCVAEHLMLPVGAISPADRWRLVLAIDETQSLRVRNIATSLDQLYGHGQGEGAGDHLTSRHGPHNRGGTEAPEPSLLEWSEELESLFGSDVCQEVLGEAAETGRSSAIELLDPNSISPSIDLLRQVLALASGLPEGRATKLRLIARRITEALAKELAQRLQPSLTGLSTPRPTRRRGRRLNLSRTIQANLAKAYQRTDGRKSVIADRLIFNSPARREMDWHLTFVVDVSGSMTASVVYSALVAAVFAELPAISVRFIAFSTEVIDLSNQVEDPLGLLLQVQVGGGTHIGLGLRAARARLTRPTRSLVVLVSDFEEGVSVGEMVGEVRAIAGAGARCIGLAALDDSGVARFHQGYARLVAAAGMPVAAVSPENLARWVGDQIRGTTNGAGESSTTPKEIVSR